MHQTKAKPYNILELPKLCYLPGWRLMRLGYRTCFHTLYYEKKSNAKKDYKIYSKIRSKKKITAVVYADDLVLLVMMLAQAES